MGAGASSAPTQTQKQCENCGFCAHSAFHSNAAWVADHRARYGDDASARHCCHRCFLGQGIHGAFCEQIPYVAPEGHHEARSEKQVYAREFGTLLYHQTDAAIADKILRTQQMKPGTKGLAGGGIYFATTAELTGHKAIRRGVILKAYVSLGKILTLDADGDTLMTPDKLKNMSYDSVCIARKVSSGHEYVVYDPSKVLLIERA